MCDLNAERRRGLATLTAITVAQALRQISTKVSIRSCRTAARYDFHPVRPAVPILAKLPMIHHLCGSKGRPPLSIGRCAVQMIDLGIEMRPREEPGQRVGTYGSNPAGPPAMPSALTGTPRNWPRSRRM